MCRCVSENRRSRSSYSAEWLNHSGQVVHPAAPQGVGGPGVFRSAGVFASDGGDDLLPHPRSPAVKTVDPSLVRDAEKLEAAKAVRQPPPKVSANSVETIGAITVTLKKDGSGADVDGADTDFSSKDSGDPTYKFDAENVVTGVSNTRKYAVVIQTRYGSGKPETDAEYGRGTTDDDKEAGNVTLGFHESCHRQDLLNYFRAAAQPKYTAKKGQTKVEADKEVQKFETAWVAYFDKIRELTVMQTDEVGDPPKSVADAALAMEDEE